MLLLCPGNKRLQTGEMWPKGKHFYTAVSSPGVNRSVWNLSRLWHSTHGVPHQISDFWGSGLDFIHYWNVQGLKWRTAVRNVGPVWMIHLRQTGPHTVRTWTLMFCTGLQHLNFQFKMENQNRAEQDISINPLSYMWGTAHAYYPNWLISTLMTLLCHNRFNSSLSPNICCRGAMTKERHAFLFRVWTSQRQSVSHCGKQYLNWSSRAFRMVM